MSHPMVVHIRKSPYDVFCGRGSVWGNDWTHLPLNRTTAKYQVKNREESVARHREWFLSNPELMARARRELRGKVLGCYCAPESCHCEVIAEIANSPEPGPGE